MYIGPHVQDFLFLSDFLKNNPILNCIAIPPVGPKMLHTKQYTDRRTDEGAHRHDEA
jgi:hypothetical protein